MEEIRIKDNGPVENFSIKIPPDGGVVVLKGANGSGKSKTLEAIGSLLSGEGKLTPRDGQAVGMIQGLGCIITFGRTTRRAGELTAEQIESKFDISKLIDPKINDPLAADAARMKALLHLLGIEPNVTHFHELLGDKDEFEKIVPKGSLNLSDTVIMASQIKRAIEAEARREETKSQEAAAKAKANQDNSFGIDVTKEHDDSVLRQQYESSVREKSEIVARKDSNDRALRNAESAKFELEKLRGEKKDLLSVVEAEYAINVAENKVENMRELLNAAQKAYDAAIASRDKAKSQLQYAKTLETTMEKWEEQIAAAQNIETITDEQMNKANLAVEKAKTELETGVLIRKALEFLEVAKQESEKHKAHFAQAEKLRAAAGNIDNRLSSLIKTPKLKMSGGRFYTKTDRGTTLFADLSQGEKWLMAIEITVPIIGEGGIMTAEQDAWQDLQPANRLKVLAMCKEHKVVLITAIATDGKLRAEIFEDEEPRKKSTKSTKQS